MASVESLDQAQQAVAIAREVDDTALLIRALTSSGYAAAYFDVDTAGAYLVEASRLARETGDRWRLSQILVAQVVAALVARDPIAARAAAEEDAISPTRSVTGSTRAGAAGTSESHK